jgi:CHAD domain-containing protein
MNHERITNAIESDRESDSDYKKLLAVTQLRLEKFVSLFAKVLVSDHPDTIHDARVWSRRLQEALRVFFPKPRIGKSRKLFRTLRQVRRVLSDCRNVDVTLALIEDKFNSATASMLHESWELIRNYLLEKRTRQATRAGEELTRHNITQFVTRARSLLPVDGLEKEPETLLKQSIDEAFAVWNEALQYAQGNPQVDQIHALRIAGKRLRYRAELLKDLGHTSVKSRIKALKLLQDELGNWHDRHVLLQFIAEFIGRPDFLVDHPETAHALLAEMERERQANDIAVSFILKSAEKTRDVWGRSKSGIVEK